MAILGSFICGWMFLLSLTFSMQVNDGVPDGIYGTYKILQGAFASRFNGDYRGAAGFQFILFIASNFCGIFCITANSRMLYAFSRDHGVFGSRWWKQVNLYTGTPTFSIIGELLD